MMRRMSEKELDAYIKAEKLDTLIDFSENADVAEGVYDGCSGELKIPFPPVKQDLVQLHKFIREKHFFTILEFGRGYSTVIMADALRKNEEDFNKLRPIPEIRNRYKFQVFSVDTSKDWLELSKKRLSEELQDRVHLSYSPAQIGTYQNQICSYYGCLPDIVPDFIYLDGPSPSDVDGDVNGMTFKCWERTIVAGDCLLMESIMLPGTNIWVDGRVNNTRFLENNFKRNFVKYWYKDMDITIFELQEERLGKYNVLGSDLFPNISDENVI